MKVRSLAPLAVAVFALTTFAAGAQTAAPSQAPPADAATAQHQRRMPDPDHQLRHMTRRLNLTEAQQQQIRPILLERQQKMMAIRNDSSLSDEQRREGFRNTMRDSNTQIRTALDDAQRQKWDKAREERGEHRHAQAVPAPPAK